MASESFRRRNSRFFGADPKQDVDDELAFHIAMRTEEFKRAGMSPDEARQAALDRFGPEIRVRQELEELSQRRFARQRRSTRWEALAQDARYAVRTLLANPAYTIIIGLTMALGIGATTAVFSVAYGVLLRPLPYDNAEALVRLWSRNDARGLEFFSVSPADFRDWRAQARVFSTMGAFERQRDATLSRGDEPQSVVMANVTPEIFQVLGTLALHGRALVPADASEGATPVAVLEHALWAARFGSDPSIIGSDLTIDGVTHTVVGVMPPRFWVPGTPAELWVPFSLAGASDDHSARTLRVLARLAPGATVERARMEMDVVAQRLAREHPATNASWSVNMMPVTEMIIGTDFQRAVVVLLGVVGFVLLIACANAANLQLARGAARRREIAVRAALGASRGRISIQLLTESVLLAVVAGAAGLTLAYAGVELLRDIGTEMVPRLDDVRLDLPVLAFTAVVALGSGVMFGLLPAIRVSRANIGEVLKAAGRGEGRGTVGQGMRSTLVIAEVSLSLVLLVGAGLLMRSFARLQSVDVGFDPAGVVVVPVQLPETSYPDSQRTATFYSSLVERVQQLPGVSHAAAVSGAPFAGGNSGNVFFPDGRAISREEAPDADYRIITPGYLRTMGIRLIRGREFTAADDHRAPGAMLISETMARRFWPNEDPIGQRVRIGDATAPPETIVGMVADARYQSLETPEIRPMMYLSALARRPRAMTLVVRGSEASDQTAAIQRTVMAMDAALPPPAVRRMQGLIAEAMSTPRFALMLFAVFAGTALLLAAVGIYGVMSYLVRQRTHELGVRVALGAQPRALVASVVGRAVRMAIVGVAIGLAGAWALTRSMSSLLFGVSPTDPATFAAISVLLVSIAAIASLVPAGRAARADPVRALRGED
jgi:predicted permease